MDGKPLSNIEVIITRAEHQLEKTVQQFEELGATVIKASTIRIDEPPPADDPTYQRGSWLIPKAQVKKLLWRFDWLIFTSVNAVKYAEKTWSSLGGIKGALSYTPSKKGEQSIRQPRIACIGKSTYSALKLLNIDVAIMPKKYHAEGLLTAFEDHPLHQKRILIPRALVAREILPEALRERGAEVWITPLYQTVPALIPDEVKVELIKPLVSHDYRILTFTSDSTMNSLIDQLSEPQLEWLKKLCKVFVIGPVTKRAAQREGFKVSGVAQPHTIDGLIQTIIHYFKS